MWSKAGDSETKKDLEEATGESVGGAAIDLDSQRKGGLGDKFRGLGRAELPLPIAPLLEVSWEPSEFRRRAPDRQERRGRAPGGGEHAHEHVLLKKGSSTGKRKVKSR